MKLFPTKKQQLFQFKHHVLLFLVALLLLTLSQVANASELTSTDTPKSPSDAHGEQKSKNVAAILTLKLHPDKNVIQPERISATGKNNIPDIFGKKPLLANTAESYGHTILRMWEEVLEKDAKDPVFIKTASGLPRASGMPKVVEEQWNNLMKKYPGMDAIEKLRAINGFFNQWQSRSDQETYGTPEHWAYPAEFIKNRGGDCEDYVIAKYFALRSLSWPDDRMWIVLIVNDPTNQNGNRITGGSGHAVLAVEYKNEVYILDNLSRPKNLVLPQKNYNGSYVPFCVLNHTNIWAFKSSSK